MGTSSRNRRATRAPALQVVAAAAIGLAAAQAMPAHAAKVRMEASAVHAFDGVRPGGVTPTGALLQGSDGALYGATAAGGPYDAGTLFRLTLDGASYKTIAAFGFDAGAQPVGDLVEGSDGSLYGVTTNGGDYNGGTLFRIAPDGTHTVAYSFDASTYGGHPRSGLVKSVDGAFYGVLPEGGQTKTAHIYRLSTDGAFAWIAELPAGCSGYGDRLSEDGRGHLYGTAKGAAFSGNSCLFEADKRGHATVVYRFTEGELPEGGVVPVGDALYGIASGQSVFEECGLIYQLTPSREFNKLRVFDCVPDNYPTSPLTPGSDGYLHGIGYVNQLGYVESTVYRIAPNGRFEQKAIDTDVGGDLGALVQANNGDFYANAASGGPLRAGSVVKIVQTPR